MSNDLIVGRCSHVSATASSAFYSRSAPAERAAISSISAPPAGSVSSFVVCSAPSDSSVSPAQQRYSISCSGHGDAINYPAVSARGMFNIPSRPNHRAALGPTKRHAAAARRDRCSGTRLERGRSPGLSTLRPSPFVSAVCLLWSLSSPPVSTATSPLPATLLRRSA